VSYALSGGLAAGRATRGFTGLQGEWHYAIAQAAAAQCQIGVLAGTWGRSIFMLEGGKEGWGKNSPDPIFFFRVFGL
jgi:hypothetical protein